MLFQITLENVWTDVDTRYIFNEYARAHDAFKDRKTNTFLMSRLYPLMLKDGRAFCYCGS